MKAVGFFVMLLAVLEVVRAQEVSLTEGARVCDLDFDSGAALEQKATLCAEAFVTRNGYTESPPSESSSHWVREKTDGEASWSEIFAGRHGTLDGMAEGIDCSNERCVVLFRSREGECRYRAIAMTRMLSEMQVADVVLTSAGCDE